MIANIVVLFAQKRVGIVAVSIRGNKQSKISVAGAFGRNAKW